MADPTPFPDRVRPGGALALLGENEAPNGERETGLSTVPFPSFDAGRLTDSRSVLAARYAVLKTRMPLAPVPSRDTVTRRLQALAREMPNFQGAIDRVSDELALARRTAPRAALRLPPMLLVGPPGAGKTRFAGRLAHHLGLAWRCLALAGATDNRVLAGTARGWSTTYPSWPIEQLVELKVANPLLMLDEVDKAGGSDSNGRALQTLLTLLEPTTARLYLDECLGGPIDISGINWLLTANSLENLPPPLLSRLVVVHVSTPSPDQVGTMLATMHQDVARERGIADPRLLPALPQSSVAHLKADYARHRDPRRLRAALLRLLALSARIEEQDLLTSNQILH